MASVETSQVSLPPFKWGTTQLIGMDIRKEMRQGMFKILKWYSVNMSFYSLFQKYLFFLFACVYACACMSLYFLHTCRCLQGPEGGPSPSTGVTSCELPNVKCWESNSGPLQGKSMFLVTQPLLELHLFPLYQELCIGSCFPFCLGEQGVFMLTCCENIQAS